MEAAVQTLSDIYTNRSLKNHRIIVTYYRGEYIIVYYYSIYD